MAKTKKLITISKLEKLVWKWFSLAVRIRDAQPNGLCKCITCNNQPYYYGTSVCHAGHFRSRTEKSVKYNWQNVNAQCARCNTYGAGEQFIYGNNLDKKYGEGTAETLTVKGKQVNKLTRDFLEQVKQESFRVIWENAKEKNLWEWKEGFTKTELNELEKYINGL